MTRGHRLHGRMPRDYPARTHRGVSFFTASGSKYDITIFPLIKRPCRRSSYNVAVKARRCVNEAALGTRGVASNVYGLRSFIRSGISRSYLAPDDVRDGEHNYRDLWFTRFTQKRQSRKRFAREISANKRRALSKER